MKADRLVSLLLVLQGCGRRTARELAAELEVSERTVYRDVDALSAAGIPVYAERGSNGGIVLSEGYRRALLHLGEDDVRALFLSGSAILSDLGLDGSGERAFAKLRGGLSALQQRALDRTRGRIHIDQRRWNQDAAPVGTIAVLRRAVWEDRCVEIVYRDRRRAETTRRADPYGLVSKAGVWYAVARCGGEMRSFRVDRIVAVTLLDARFERPADFNLDAYWSESSRRFMQPSEDALAVDVRAQAHIFEQIDGFWPWEPLDPDDPSFIRIVFPSERAARNWVFMWGVDVEIIRPIELRATVIAHAHRVAHHHTSHAETACQREDVAAAPVS